MKNPVKSFDDVSEVFAYCREKDAPVEVLLWGGKYRAFPSGRLERLFKTCPTCLKDLAETIPLHPNGVCPGCGAKW